VSFFENWHYRKIIKFDDCPTIVVNKLSFCYCTEISSIGSQPNYKRPTANANDYRNRGNSNRNSNSNSNNNTRTMFIVLSSWPKPLREFTRFNW